MKFQSRNRFSSGFTLIEIMVVIIIIGIIAALFAPNIVGRGDQAKRIAAETNLRMIGTTLDLYRLDNSHYPSTDQGLEALVSRPHGYPQPKNYNPDAYARKNSLNDPWGIPYIYISDGSSFDLRSLGADGAEGGEGIAEDLVYRDL